MSISYPNLPGIEVLLKDGGLILPEEASTETLLIIGPTTKTVGSNLDAGEVPENPILIRAKEDLVANNFVTQGQEFVDSTGKVNTLTAAWKAAYEGGARRIYLLAVNNADTTADGQYKKYFLGAQKNLFGILQDFTVNNVVVIDGFADKETVALATTDFGGNDPAAEPGVIEYAYERGSSSAVAEPLTITLSSNDTISFSDSANTGTITLAAATYNTVDDVITEINKKLASSTNFSHLAARNDDKKIVIYGAKAFSITGGLALPSLNITAGDAVKNEFKGGGLFLGNFAEVVSAYCENQTINRNSIIGYVGTTSSAANTLSSVKTHTDNLVSKKRQYSGYLSIVAGPDLGYSLPGLSDFYYANGVVTYAALVTNLRPESATTNKPVYGVSAMRYNLSLRQLDSLTGAQYVTFRLKGNQVHVTDGITTAKDQLIGNVTYKSDYIRLSTLRITQAAIRLVREIADPFIGEPNGMPQRNALNAAVRGGLEGMKAAGAIADYRFTITATPRQRILGQSSVTLELVPAFEMKKITVDVSLSAQMDNQA